MTLEERIEKLEKRAERSERILRIIGEKMEEFDFDSLLDDIEQTKEDTKETKPEPEVVETAPEPEENLDDLLEEVPSTEVTSPAPTTIEEPEPETYDNTGVEFAAETKAYAKEYLSIEMRKRALNEELKKLKDDYKDQGVDIATVNKAMKEIAKELKESAEEAACVERVKEMFKKDERIYTDIVGLND